MIVQVRQIRGSVSARPTTKLNQAQADPVCVMRDGMGVESSATSSTFASVLQHSQRPLRLSFPYSGVDGELKALGSGTLGRRKPSIRGRFYLGSDLAPAA